MSRRKVYTGEVHHICQMTVGKVVIFYTVADYLVFFTIYCTFAEKYDVEVLAVCPMPDHLHNSVIVRSAKQLSTFVRDYGNTYARLWNKSRSRRGQLFYHSYQCSAKLGNKQVRSTLAYNYNNPVERKLVERAEEYRWNFLPYATSANPYSQPVEKKNTSQAYKRAANEVKYLRNTGQFLNYSLIERLFEKLTTQEKQQLIDYIIGLWNIIDFQKAISYYGSIETMIRAFHDNTGADYDIKEDRDPYSDTVYSDCIRILTKEQLVSSLYDIPMLPMERKLELYQVLRQRTSARPKQLRKFLHIPKNEVTD